MGSGVGIPEDGNEYIVGPTLSFDPDTETHVGDYASEANVLLKDRNRKGYEVPTADTV